MNKGMTFALKLVSLLGLDCAIVLILTEAWLNKKSDLFPFAIGNVILSLMVFNFTVLAFAELKNRLTMPVAASGIFVSFFYFLVTLIYSLLVFSTFSIIIYLIFAFISFAIVAAIFAGLSISGAHAQKNQKDISSMK